MTATCASQTTRLDMGVLDLAELSERIVLDLAAVRLGENPTSVRVEIHREKGWATQNIVVSRLVSGVELALSTPISIAPPTAPVPVADAAVGDADLSTPPALSIGSAAVEAGAKVRVIVHLSWPIEPGSKQARVVAIG